MRKVCTTCLHGDGTGLSKFPCSECDNSSSRWEPKLVEEAPIVYDYVRCKECDSAFHTDSFKGSDLIYTLMPDNRRASFECPACGYYQMGNIFKECAGL